MWYSHQVSLDLSRLLVDDTPSFQEAIIDTSDTSASSDSEGLQDEQQRHIEEGKSHHLFETHISESFQHTPPRIRHINDLSGEIIQTVISYLTSSNDLVAAMCVQKRWLIFGALRLWSKPTITNERQLCAVTEIMKNGSSGNTIDYSMLVQRVNLSYTAKYVTDDTLSSFSNCVNLQRLVIANCSSVSASAVSRVLSALPRLESVDLQDVDISDDTLIALAQNNEVQTLLVSCLAVTDRGLLSMARKSGRHLRRLRLTKLPHVTPQGVLEMVKLCPKLLELDVCGMRCFSETELSLSAATYSQPGFIDEDIRVLFGHCPLIRELRLSNCLLMASTVFSPWNSGLTIKRLDSLRVLSLATCPQITDTAVMDLTVAAPRIRHLNLSKCPLITDRSVEAIAVAYNSGLQYLHLGHCSKITDYGVGKVADLCPRLSFFDAANCMHLTDLSLVKLSALPRLRRIGVVRCPKIGYRGVVSLSYRRAGVAERPIERLHLSYCSLVPVTAIWVLVNFCPKLVHLSLTGIPCFLNENIRCLRRAPPRELNAHQREMFCVFSGSAIGKLRSLLNSNPSLRMIRRVSQDLEDAANIPSWVLQDPPNGPFEGLFSPNDHDWGVSPH